MQTITKAFDTYDKAHGAVDKLVTAGIDISEISILANRSSEDDDDQNELNDDTDQTSEAGTGAGLGAAAGGAAGLLAGLGMLAIPGLGPVVAAGWLASTAVGAVAGGATGGIVGSLINSGVPEAHAHVYSEPVRRGGTLVSVQAEDHEVETVHAVLNDFMPIDPDRQRETYRETGWNTFDPGAGPFQANQSETKRAQRFV